jgi:hypothetical protein
MCGITKTYLHNADNSNISKIVNMHSGTSVHERPCSRTIRFTNKFSGQKPSRMTNGVSDYEHATWQQRQAEGIGAGVSVAG